MRTPTLIVCRSLALLALILTGCAAPAQTTGARSSAAAPSPDSATVVLEVSLRRSAELSDSRGALRVFDQDLRVEYRTAGRGPGLDAGEVTLDGRPLLRVVGGKGAVSYRLGRDEPPGGVMTNDDPWATLANSGGPGFAATRARIKLAPFPVVTQPTTGQGVMRSDELPVVMMPPAAEVWYRVSLRGAGESVSAVEFGQGRWLFPTGVLAPLAPGHAHILIEVETSCGDCEVGPRLHARWSTHSELEVPVTLL